MDIKLLLPRYCQKNQFRTGQVPPFSMLYLIGNHLQARPILRQTFSLLACAVQSNQEPPNTVDFSEER